MRYLSINRFIQFNFKEDLIQLWDSLRNLHGKFHERIEEMQRLGGLRIWILHVLDDGPKNGVEIMDSIEQHYDEIGKMRRGDDRFNKHIRHSMKHAPKRPSPGSVYPMLKKMVDENLIIKGEEGKYELTDKGKQIAYKVFGHLKPHNKHMDRGAVAVEHILTEMDSYVSYLEDIKRERLIQHEELIDDLSIRLKNIKKSLHED